MAGPMKMIEISVAATRLGVSESTVRRMIVDPLSPLRAVRIYRGGIKVIPESVDECFKEILKRQQFDC